MQATKRASICRFKAMCRCDGGRPRAKAKSGRKSTGEARAKKPRTAATAGAAADGAEGGASEPLADPEERADHVELSEEEWLAKVEEDIEEISPEDPADVDVAEDNWVEQQELLRVNKEHRRLKKDGKSDELLEREAATFADDDDALHILCDESLLLTESVLRLELALVVEPPAPTETPDSARHRKRKRERALWDDAQERSMPETAAAPPAETNA